MHQQLSRHIRAHSSFTLAIVLCVGTLLCAGPGARAQQQTQTPTASPTPAALPPVGSPSRVVLDFYQALRDRKFREAFAMSIWKPAIDGLSQAEFDELRPEFEKMAAAVPDQIELSGEQISGEEATVFARSTENAGQMDSIPLIRLNGVWIFGDRKNYQIVQSKGAAFFPEARIEQHHKEVEAVLVLIANAEAAYAAQHGGVYADLPTLIESKPSLKDDVESDTLGYNFHILLGGKTYAVAAEPARYGHTGRLSYYMDNSGYKSKDTGGKPFTPPGAKRP